MKVSLDELDSSGGVLAIQKNYTVVNSPKHFSVTKIKKTTAEAQSLLSEGFSKNLVLFFDSLTELFDKNTDKKPVLNKDNKELKNILPCFVNQIQSIACCNATEIVHCKDRSGKDFLFSKGDNYYGQAGCQDQRSFIPFFSMIRFNEIMPKNYVTFLKQEMKESSPEMAEWVKKRYECFMNDEEEQEHSFASSVLSLFSSGSFNSASKSQSSSPTTSWTTPSAASSSTQPSTSQSYMPTDDLELDQSVDSKSSSQSSSSASTPLIYQTTSTAPRTLASDLAMQEREFVDFRVKQIACEYSTSFVLSKNNLLFAFGSNTSCKIGLPVDNGCIKNKYFSPILLNPYLELKELLHSNQGERMIKIYCQCCCEHCFVQTNWGRLIAFGFNNAGQLSVKGGNEDKKNRRAVTPTEVPLALSGIKGEDIKTIACGAYFSLLLLKNGKLFGSGNLGPLGGKISKKECFYNFVEVPYFQDKNVTLVGCGENFCVVVVDYCNTFFCGTDSNAVFQKLDICNNIKSVVCGYSSFVLLTKEQELIEYCPGSDLKETSKNLRYNLHQTFAEEYDYFLCSEYYKFLIAFTKKKKFKSLSYFVDNMKKNCTVDPVFHDCLIYCQKHTPPAIPGQFQPNVGQSQQQPPQQ